MAQADRSVNTDRCHPALSEEQEAWDSVEDQRAEVPASSLHRLSMAPELRSHADGNGSPHKHEANEEDA